MHGYVSRGDPERGDGGVSGRGEQRLSEDSRGANGKAETGSWTSHSMPDDWTIAAKV